MPHTITSSPVSVGTQSSDAQIASKQSTRYADAAQAVRNSCADHGISAGILQAKFADAPELCSAARYVFGDSVAVPTRRTMRDLVHEVEKLLDLQEPLADLATLATRGARVSRDVFAGLVAAVSGWIVIGAILTGDNAMAASTSAGITLIALATALLVLALLEAAHIGAVALSTADVSTLKDTHPRVFKLHRHINTKSKLESYLAARQLGVVMIVFVIAELTRTARLNHLPGTSIQLPAAIQFLLQIGVPGALVVLIIGQVTPQILTARRPAALMNLAPMSAAFYATLNIGRLGLARPAAWLTGGAGEPERIPSAPAERFSDATRDVAGFGALGVTRDINVALDKTTTTTATTVQFFSDELSTVELSAASAPLMPTQLKIRGHMYRDGESDELMVDLTDEVRNEYGLLLNARIAPRIGAFQNADIVQITATATFSSLLSEDFVLVEQPTKLVTVRATIEHPPVPLPPAMLTVHRTWDDEHPEMKTVRPARNEDGTVSFVETVAYPDVGTIIKLAWAPMRGLES